MQKKTFSWQSRYYFSLYANVYKHVYGDFKKDEKEKATICKEGHGDRP